LSIAHFKFGGVNLRSLKNLLIDLQLEPYYPMPILDDVKKEPLALLPKEVKKHTQQFTAKTH